MKRTALIFILIAFISGFMLNGVNLSASNEAQAAKIQTEKNDKKTSEKKLKKKNKSIKGKDKLVAENDLKLEDHPKAETVKGRKIPILMYHDVTLDPLKTNKICVTRDRFERDMDYLQKSGYTTISFKDLIAWKKGEGELPAKPVIITFDDGRPGVYDYAYPILKEKNMKMTFFVIGKRLEQRPEDRKFGKYINWDQAKEMYDSGLIEIQPHTYDMHYTKESLTRGIGVLPLKGESYEGYYNRFRDDTIKIMEEIKLKTGSDSYVFSFPLGKKTELNDRVIEELGFSASVVTNTHYSDISGELYDLKRINVPSHIELRELMERVKSVK